MGAYYFILCFILINGITARKHRKWYVVSTFLVVFVFAALRKYTIGIDLELHYARNFERIAKLPWSEVPSFIAYDPGFNILCKLISYISTDRQAFITVTSLIVFGSVARYIYYYADDVVMESFMFISMYCMFLYMNIIAQAIAFAIFLVAIPCLQEKKYIKYILIVLLATSMHASAIILLLLVPLSFLPLKRKYVAVFSLAMPIALMSLDKLAVMFATIIPEFSRYLDVNNIHGKATGLSNLMLIIIIIYALILFLAWWYLLKSYNEESVYRLVEKNFGILKKRRDVEVLQLSSNLLAYATIIVIAARLAGTNMEVSSRIGYYFYVFSYSLLGRALASIRDFRERTIFKFLIYSGMILFFLVSGSMAAQVYYGVAPYEFFWN